MEETPFGNSHVCRPLRPIPGMLSSSHAHRPLCFDSPNRFAALATDENSDPAAQFSSDPSGSSAPGDTRTYLPPSGESSCRQRLTALALNAQGKLSTVLSWENFLSQVDTLYPSWDIAFISEVDGFLGDRSPIDVPGLHMARHWPGCGSRAMAFV